MAVPPSSGKIMDTLCPPPDIFLNVVDLGLLLTPSCSLVRTPSSTPTFGRENFMSVVMLTGSLALYLRQ